MTMRRPFGLWRWLLVGLLIWIGTDLFVPRKHSIRQFDPATVAQLETDMWRAYYDKNPALLFWQLAGGLRQQFGAPFWRSFVLAFQATRAAFVFKQGGSQADYDQALPLLETYYDAVQRLSIESFRVPDMAREELNWWIVHRQRDRYTYADLALALDRTAAVLYERPAPAFARYGQLRAEAMRLCDEAGRGATEADWQRIDQVLNQAWSELHRVVRPKTPNQ
ncbi:hypothetical protein GCM10027578_13170 [Spirosoma luteolum]